MMRSLVSRYLTAWRAWRSAKLIPQIQETDRALERARRSHRPRIHLIQRKRELVHERLRREIGAR